MIEDFWDELGSASWLDSQQRAWHPYLFRLDDVRNVASILKCGAVYSRNECNRRNLPHIDSAHQGVIARSHRSHDYARLYFRPRTPTQYVNEGIQRRASVAEGAHCPVPVFLLFDAKRVLTRFGVEFTDGNFGAAQSTKGSDAAFLRSLPFRHIYSHQAFPPEHRDEIIFRRNAEVIVRAELDLEDLEWIVCRTGAERETLLQLLDEEAPTWTLQTRLEGVDENCFTRRKVFVEAVTFDGLEVSVRFQSFIRPGMYRYVIRVFDKHQTTQIIGREGDFNGIGGTRRLKLPTKQQSVFVRLEIEGALAYGAIVTSKAVF